MQIHPQRILWPTDLSPLSLKGAEYAKVFAKTFGAQLYVIHVAPMLVSSPTTAMMTGGDNMVGAIDTVTPGKRELHKLLRSLFPEEKTPSEVVSGVPWDEICRYANENQVDLIILSTHGATGFKHLLMGSTAERVVQHAHCPVLTVKNFVRDFVSR